MKKVLSLILALVLCLSLCACSNPLAEEFSSIDEVVAALAEHYDSEEDHQTIKENTSIAKYFQKDHMNDEIWKKLSAVTDESGNKVFFMSEIYDLYNVCNNPYLTFDSKSGSDGEAVAGEAPSDNDEWTWFRFLNVGTDGYDKPLAMYGPNAMTVDRLTSSIKHHFKDPDSVSVENAWMCIQLPEGVVNADDFMLYEESRYIMLAEIRGKNSFGATVSDTFKITGDFRGDSWTFGVRENEYPVFSLLGRPSFEIDGYGDWMRIF